MIISTDAEKAHDKNPIPIHYKNAQNTRNRRECLQFIIRHL